MNQLSERLNSLSPSATLVTLGYAGYVAKERRA